MIAGLDPAVAAICLVAVFVGAAIQGWIGIGLGLVAAPVLAIADSDFVPGTIVIAVIPLSIAVTWSERTHVNWRDAGLAIVGRLPGVIVGAVVAAAVSDRMLSLLVGLSVLLAVIVSLSNRRIPLTDATLFGAGATSGFTGTTTGVGGPPMALTYQHRDPAVMRATISAFFLVGAAMSASALWAAGEIGERQIELTLLIMPAVILGIVAAAIARRRLSPRFVRPLVLLVCAGSAVVLLVTAL